MNRLLALGLILASVTACSRAGQTTRAPTTSLTLAQQREPMSLNPALENGTSSTELGLLLFQYLVKFDDRGRLIGDAATSVPTPANGGVSPDGLTISYHLRRGLRFADGTPLTARDCVWSIQAVQNPANNVQSRYGYDRIDRAEAPNATTLVLHLREPFAPLITLVLAPQGFPILPEHLLAKQANFNHVAFDALPVGSGPYVVTRWDRGDRLEMRANPYYWQGKPAIE
ncbi:MAG TPA: ABC transporter substrate-binding protein, partial [Candidatus Tumulicola sp.]